MKLFIVLAMILVASCHLRPCEASMLAKASKERPRGGASFLGVKSARVVADPAGNDTEDDKPEEADTEAEDEDDAKLLKEAEEEAAEPDDDDNSTKAANASAAEAKDDENA